MGWFWADKEATTSNNINRSAGSSSGCPIVSKSGSVGVDKPSCPVDYGKSSIFNKDKNNDNSMVMNPMNNMPMDISSQRLPGQKISLPTERTISSIPRGESDDQGLWEYPSPQQMLNAMVRKGKGENIPEDAVESMVDVHNFLNEGAWQQILEWEKDYTKQTKVEPRLLKFTGRPYDLSPRARSLLFLSKIFPQTFNDQPPFDRHDWTVLRSKGKDRGWQEVRYVIDYYSAPDDEATGMPAFILDTRPALDSPTAVIDRFNHWSQPLWKKAMGEF